MKIRNNSRIVAFVLALVMILPLISIPAFAEDAVEAPKAFTEYSESFDGKAVTDATVARPKSAQIVAAALDAEKHGDVLQIDVKGMNDAPYYLWQNSNNKWPITGEVVDGKISGTANGMDVPATDVPTDDNDTSKKVTIGETTYTVVTGVYADSMGGFTNVAAPATLANPAYKSADSEFVFISFDLFLSEDFKNSMGVSGRMAGTSAGNVELFELTAKDGANPTLSSHENGSIVGGAAAPLTKNAWNTLTFVIDTGSAAVTVFVNGAYAFSETNGTALGKAIDINANKLQIQIDRNGAPSTNGGFIQIDNLLVTDDASKFVYGGTLYEQNFDAATATSDVLTGSANAGLATIKTDDAGNKVFNAPSQPGGEGYYLWKDYNSASKLVDYVLNDDGTISGTAENGVQIANSVINPENGKDPATFAILADGSTSTEWKVATAKFVDARNGGQFNVAGNGGQLANPAFSFVGGKVAISADYYFSADASFGNQGRIYADSGVATNRGYDLFQMNAANGKVTVTNHGDAVTARGDVVGNKRGSSVSVPAGEWFNVTMIFDSATSMMDLYVNGTWVFSLTDTDFGASNVKKFRANTLSVTMFTRGLGALNNVGYCEVDNVSITYGNEIPTVDPTQYIVRENFELYQAGAAMSTGAGISNLGGLANTKISDAYGSKAWAITFERPNGENKTNIDKNPKLTNPALSYTDYDSIVYEVDYFFPTDAIGQIQNQFTSSQAFVGAAEAASKVSFVDLYQIYFSNGGAQVQFESARDVDSTTGKTTAKKAKFATGKWVTVSEVINLDTGLVEIYIDGELMIDDVQLYRGGALTNITIAEKQIISAGKVNKVNGGGTYHVDNIRIFEGTAPSVSPKEKKLVHDFEEYGYNDGKPANNAPYFTSAPALLTYASVNGDVALRLDMGVATSADDTWLVSSDSKNRITKGYEILEVPVTAPETEPETEPEVAPATETETVELKKVIKISGEETQYDILFDEKNDLNYFTYSDGKNYYFVRGDVAEAAYGGSNVGHALQIGHENYSYETSKTVMLEANYFIEEGSTGTIEAQFNNVSSVKKTVVKDEATGEEIEGTEAVNIAWVQLFTINMNDGRFDGTNMYMNMGEWNNVKVIIDMESGNYNMYVNGVWAKAENFGDASGVVATNITLNADWIIAKVQRHTHLTGDVYEGGLYIDDVKVTDQVEYTDAKYLSEAEMNAYANKLLTAVEGASIRLSDPTGLRFASKVDTHVLKHLETLFGEVALGTVITPDAYVDLAGGFSKEKLDALETETAYLDIAFRGEFFKGDNGFDVGEDSYIVGSIVNIKEANLDLAFAGAAYATVTIDGADYTIYADAQVRSVKDVASAALADATAEWSEAELAVLNSFVK